MQEKSLLKPLTEKLLTFIVATTFILLAGSVFVYYFAKIARTPKSVLDLSSSWKVCSGGDCVDKSIPTLTHPLPHSKDYRNFSYERSFVAPSICKSEVCSLLFSEIGDAAEIYLNGHLLAVHGGSATDFVFSKHYPVRVILDPKNLKNVNSILVKVFTTKIPQSGIRGSLNGIFLYRDAEDYVLGKIVYDIFFPILGSVILLFLALYTLRKLLIAKKTAPDLTALFWMLSAMSMVMLSSSNIPREYLPTWLCGYGHFLLRHLMDFSLFYMCLVFYRPKFQEFKILKYLFAGVAVFIVSVFLAQFLYPVEMRDNNGTAVPYVASKVFFFLRIIPYYFMLVGAWCDRREKKLGRIFSTLFVATIFALQLMDLATFWEFRAGSYFVRFFPILLGIFYASKVFEIFTEEVKEQALEGEFAKGYRKKGMQAAHDLKSPILGARFAIKQIEERMSVKEKTTLQSAIDAISEISSTLSTDFTEIEVVMPKALSPICQAVVDEKSIEYRNKGDLKITFHCEDSAIDTQASLDEVLLKRVLSNLINNSVQAITLDRVGEIQVSLRTVNDMAEITVRDNGYGVEKEKIPELFKEGFTTKPTGQGLGLYHAKESLREMGGDIVMASVRGVGTTITLKIPRALVQSSDETTIRQQDVAVVPSSTDKAQKNKNIVLIDDDEIVRYVWKSEAALQKANLKTFAHPKEFEKATTQVDPATTVIYVDACFGGETLGPKFVEQLKERGFQHVFLSTAFPSNYFETSARAHGYEIVGKESPWASA